MNSLTQVSELPPDADMVGHYHPSFLSSKISGACPAVRQFHLVDVNELLDCDFRIEFLVHGVLVKNQPAIIAAPSKSMKTTLSLDLAISLAAGGIGGRFLNQFRVEVPQRVGVMTGESGMATVQETIRRICNAKGVEAADIAGRLAVTDEIPMLNQLPDLNGVEMLLARMGLDVLICDPVYQMIDGSEAGNLFRMGQQLKPLADVCRAKNCTPVLIHHTKRTSDTVRNNEPLGLEDISWSGFAEFARQWILINRRERYREGSGEHRLWVNYGGSAGHSGLWAVDIQEGQNTAAEGRTYTVAVQEARVAREAAQAEREDRRRQQAESKQAATLSNKVERVRKVLKVNDGLTQRQIREAAGLSNTNVVEALNLLIDRGEVVREVDTVRGQERSIFRKVQG
jgi:hypothetical protein